MHSKIENLPFSLLAPGRKMKTGIILFLTSLLIIFSCAPKTTFNNHQELADSLLKANENAFNSGDAKLIANMYSEDALVIGNGKSTWTKDSIYESTKPIAPFIKNFKGHMGPISVTTDMIFMQKYYTCDWIAGGTPLKVKGTATLIWVKQTDKSWKIVLEISNDALKTF
jgi:ketosteroid isomerase-like protein